jgi:uncharacterized repeat protein (TIGR02543 family)
MIRRALSGASIFLALLLTGVLGATQPTQPSLASGFSQIADTGFESASLTGWTTSIPLSGTQTNITQTGSGVGVIASPVAFQANNFPEIPGCTPAVDPATWVFGPYATAAAILQPFDGLVSFDEATSALGLTAGDNSAIKQLITSQSVSSGCGGNPNPTDAAWITKVVTLTAGVTYRMAWNYIGTDYVPYNDGSITSLVPQNGNAPVTVNNQVGNYALLGFTNPGTGDYSTGHFGSTGWQYSTYQVSATGNYLLGFAVFNMGDLGLDPVLLVDDGLGSVTRNGQNFSAVASNNPNAPSLIASNNPNAPSLTITLSFSGNSADSGTPPASIQGSEGSLTLPQNSGNLVKSGFTFSGWNTEANGNGVTYQPGASINVTQSTNLYAKWTSTTLAATGTGNLGAEFLAIALVLAITGAILMVFSSVRWPRKRTALFPRAISPKDS